jgi:hypothetical protein
MLKKIVFIFALFGIFVIFGFSATKPSSNSDWTVGTPANRLEPGSTKKTNGFLGGERPGYKTFNYLTWISDQWDKYFEIVTDTLNIGANNIIGESGNVGIGISSTSASGILNVHNGDLIVSGTGTLGIGTTSPSRMVEIESVNTSILRVENTAPGSGSITGGSIELASLPGVSEANHANDVLGVLQFEGQGTDSPFAGGIIMSRVEVGEGTRANMKSNIEFHSMNTGESGATEKMRINGDGNVGIGDQTPTFKLDVNGDLNVGTTAQIRNVLGGAYLGPNIYISDLDANRANIESSDSLTIMADPESDNSSSFLRIGVDGVTEITIDNLRNIGIGNTNPSNKLAVQTDTSGDSFITRFENLDGASTNKITEIWVNGASASSGLFGLAAADLCGQYFQNSSATFFGNAHNAPLYIGTNNNQRLAILGNGDIGINDETPTFKLDVNGTFRTKEAAQFDSTVDVAGVVTADSYSMNISTRYLSVNPAAYMPTSSNETWLLSPVLGSIGINSGDTTSISLYAPVNIPHNAVIISFKTYWHRDDAAASGGASLSHNNFTTGSTVMASTASDSSAGFHSVEDTTITDATINNNTKTYHSTVTLTPNDSNADVTFLGAVITYTITEPLP